MEFTVKAMPPLEEIPCIDDQENADWPKRTDDCFETHAAKDGRYPSPLVAEPMESARVMAILREGRLFHYPKTPRKAQQVLGQKQLRRLMDEQRACCKVVK